MSRCCRWWLWSAMSLASAFVSAAEPAQIRLAPGECFALRTPLIEQRLQGIRLSLD